MRASDRLIKDSTWAKPHHMTTLTQVSLATKHIISKESASTHSPQKNEGVKNEQHTTGFLESPPLFLLPHVHATLILYLLYTFRRDDP